MMTSSSIDTAALMSAFAAASEQDRLALAETLAHDAALAAIFNQPPLAFGPCTLYLVDESWHLSEALTDNRFAVAASADDLTRFLNQQDGEAVIVTKASGLTLAQLEMLLDKSPYVKTVLWDNTP